MNFERDLGIAVGALEGEDEEGVDYASLQTIPGKKRGSVRIMSTK